MPELPEVETVCRTVAPHVVGRRIERLVVRDRRLRVPVDPGLPMALVGRVVTRVDRRAKFVCIHFRETDWLAVHLGMSGQLIVGTPSSEAKHVHVIMDFDDGTRMYFRDPRRFGSVRLVAEEAELGELGVEPLGDGFSVGHLQGLKRRHPRLSVKAMLMDSRRIVGVSNIYANEALFRAGIRPGRRFARLSRREIEGLRRAVRDVLRLGIELGGSSLMDYRDGDGKRGRFQETFAVYERKGEPCVRCGAPIRMRVIGGRSSFYCNRCQR